MLLTIEYLPDKLELDIVCDAEGLEKFIRELTKLQMSASGHTHFMTPSWAGDELTEDRQTETGTLINHLRVVLKPTE